MRANLQNMAFLLADEEPKITDIRAKGSPLPFYEEVFFGDGA